MYCSPSTGRFTQRDPFLGFQADPLSLNRYTYAHNNPIRYADPTGYAAVQVTMPDGSRATATITNGVTTMDNGGRPPVGAIVHAANGKDYQMQASGKGVEVPKGSAPATVSTPTGTQAATISNGVTTMTSTGQRPQNGWIVHAPNGVSYQMDASLGHGLQTTAVPVIAPDGGISIAGLRDGVTTMADGSRPQHGSLVFTPGGSIYMMDASIGRGVWVGEGSKSTGNIIHAVNPGLAPAPVQSQQTLSMLFDPSGLIGAAAWATSTVTRQGSGRHDVITTVGAPLRGSVTVSWWVTEDGSIQFNFSEENYWGVLWRGGADAFAEDMFKTVREMNSDFLSGRTIGGLSVDMQLHWAASVLGLRGGDQFVGNLGGTNPNKTGYDDNAWFFETAYAATIAVRLNPFNPLGIASLLIDYRRYIR